MAKILVVDDDPMIRNLLCGILEQQGHEVMLAADGVEALTVAQANPPSLIVLDVDMPRLNGQKTCEKLRAIPSTKDIPILMLTARKADGDIEKGLNLGADAYMTKPFEMAEFHLRIKMLLGLNP
jgi:DNA-binding response OmpR family regulator